MNTYTSFVILIFLTWPVVFVIVPMIYLTIIIQVLYIPVPWKSSVRIISSTHHVNSYYVVILRMSQKYYYASSRELMRLDGTTKSFLSSHVAESIAGVMTIRAFGEEDRFFSRSLQLIDANAGPDFHTFSAKEWLVQRLEILCAIVLSSVALAITLFHFGSSSSGFSPYQIMCLSSVSMYWVCIILPNPHSCCSFRGRIHWDDAIVRSVAECIPGGLRPVPMHTFQSYCFSGKGRAVYEHQERGS